MLVISRKTEEFVQIGKDIVIKIIKSTNGSVKIGIDAPGHLRVMRGELQEEQESFTCPTLSSRRTFAGDHCENESRGLAEVL